MNETMSMNPQPQLQIARLRRQKGVTQEDLAAHLGVTYQAVSKWETGAACPDIALLPAIAAYFHTTVDEVLGCTPTEPTPEALLPALRAAFTACPDEGRYRAAWELCCLLHEAVVTDGWHKGVPWDTSKPPRLHRYDGWGLSADVRADGFTILNTGVMTIGLRDAAASPHVNRVTVRFLERLSQPGVLETLMALSAAQGGAEEPVELSANELAKHATLPMEDCLAVLRKLEDWSWVCLGEGEPPRYALIKRLDVLLLPIITLIRAFEPLL